MLKVLNIIILHAFPKNLQASNYFISFAGDLLSNAELKCKEGVPNSETQNRILGTTYFFLNANAVFGVKTAQIKIFYYI